MQRIALFSAAVLVFATLLFIAGCGSSGGRNILNVHASATTLPPGGSINFTATKAVNWCVSELRGGSITSSGVYTAPPVTGIFHVVATSVDNAAQRTTCTVTVTTVPPQNVFAAAPMADAAYHNQPNGANLIRWPAQGARVLAYLLYRDTNPNVPIAVIQAPMTSYQDSASPLPLPDALLESTTVTIQIDQNTAAVTQFDYDTTYDATMDLMGNPALSLSRNSFSITARRVPISPGVTCAYHLRTLSIQSTPPTHANPTGFPAGYHLVLGDISAPSAYVTLTTPSSLISPQKSNLPYDGVYRCAMSPCATSYLLQVSPDPLFPPNGTYSAIAFVQDASTALATFSFADLCNTFAGADERMIYWRMGARVDGSTLPFAVSYPNVGGWVFSLPYSFSLQPMPPGFLSGRTVQQFHSNNQPLMRVK